MMRNENFMAAHHNGKDYMRICNDTGVRFKPMDEYLARGTPNQLEDDLQRQAQSLSHASSGGTISSTSSQHTHGGSPSHHAPAHTPLLSPVEALTLTTFEGHPHKRNFAYLEEQRECYRPNIVHKRQKIAKRRQRSVPVEIYTAQMARPLLVPYSFEDEFGMPDSDEPSSPEYALKHFTSEQLAIVGAHELMDWFTPRQLRNRFPPSLLQTIFSQEERMLLCLLEISQSQVPGDLLTAFEYYPDSRACGDPALDNLHA